MMPEKNASGIKILAENRKARYNYTILETYECGIELRGTEVKSMKDGKFSFVDSYAVIEHGECILKSFHISPYTFGNLYNHDPDRPRRLLLHKQEIKKLYRKTEERGFTLVPLKFYLKNGRVKLELAVCQGKKSFDKRDSIKERDMKREVAREFRSKLH